MKEQINKNFKLSLSIAGILFFSVVLGIIIVCVLNFGIGQMGSNIAELSSRDEIGDVEGYGILIDIIGYGMGALGLVIVWITMIIVPGILGLFIFLFALIAKLIYQKNTTKVLTYRVLMGFSYAGQILTAYLCCSSGFSFSVAGCIRLLMSIYMIWAICMGIRGTYTNRIKGELLS